MCLNLHVLCLYYLLILAFTLGCRLLLLSHKPSDTNAANLVVGCGHAKFSTLRNGMDSFRVILCLYLGKLFDCAHFEAVDKVLLGYQESNRQF